MEAGGDPRHHLLKRCFLVELVQHQAGPKVYCRAKERHWVRAVPTLQRIQDFYEANLGPHADSIIAAQGLARPTRQQNWLLPAVAAGFDVYAGWPRAAQLCLDAPGARVLRPTVHGRCFA
jgi:hypothetical protein